jgi:hypothetical protein
MKRKCQTMKMMICSLLWNQKWRKLGEILSEADFLARHPVLRKCKQLEKAEFLLLLKQPPDIVIDKTDYWHHH